MDVIISDFLSGLDIFLRAYLTLTIAHLIIVLYHKIKYIVKETSDSDLAKDLHTYIISFKKRKDNNVDTNDINQSISDANQLIDFSTVNVKSKGDSVSIKIRCKPKYHIRIFELIISHIKEHVYDYKIRKSF